RQGDAPSDNATRIIGAGESTPTSSSSATGRVDPYGHTTFGNFLAVASRKNAAADKRTLNVPHKAALPCRALTKWPLFYAMESSKSAPAHARPWERFYLCHAKRAEWDATLYPDYVDRNSASTHQSRSV
ncbi:hypothetical protein THAOC_23861, partial [Thalassiosira oceanica]